jgi:hypothetical protein
MTMKADRSLRQYSPYDNPCYCGYGPAYVGGPVIGLGFGGGWGGGWHGGGFHGGGFHGGGGGFHGGGDFHGGGHRYGVQFSELVFDSLAIS